jgi:hypothetical protein
LSEAYHIQDPSDWPRHIAKLVEQINADPRLALAAASNPFLALAELGYVLAPAVERDIEERARYSKKQVAERRKIKADLAELLGRAPESLTREILQAIIRTDITSATKPADPSVTAKKAKSAASLAARFLAIEDSARRFADVETYAAIRNGERKISSLKLKARLAADRSKPAGGKKGSGDA